jgi:carbon-monoxide dehydrogenase medium subunit
MKPAPFEYAAPESTEELLSLLGEHGDTAKVLAGGQSLGPMLNMRLAFPELLVDINRLEELSYIEVRDDQLIVGALARQREVERFVTEHPGWPLLREAMPVIGHVTNRNRGTVCGSIAHADPAAELPAVATALGAEIRVAGPRGERVVNPEDFFVSYLMTNLEPDEFLSEVRFPATPPRTGSAWLELARRHGDYAIAGVGAVLTLDEGGQCGSARLVYIGVSSTPFHAQEAVASLVGEEPTEELFASVAAQAAEESEPGSDIHASAAYRQHLVKVLTRQALGRALRRAKGEADGA